MNTTMQQVRTRLAEKLSTSQFTSINREKSMTELTGSTTIELVNASFIASDEALFGDVSWDYVRREEQWYDSMSLNVNDIPGGPPKIWQAVADKDGFINSNYGWCIYSDENVPGAAEANVSRPLPQPLNQYNLVLTELLKNPESRRAVMIYTRPSMWLDYDKNGRSDFMCTNTVQYLVRDGALHAIVQMRSNDAIMGFKNDRAWQAGVQGLLASDLGVPVGPLHWNAGSLHVYARHYYLVDHFMKTGETSITQERYRAEYPASPYLSSKP